MQTNQAVEQNKTLRPSRLRVYCGDVKVSIKTSVVSRSLFRSPLGLRLTVIVLGRASVSWSEV